MSKGGGLHWMIKKRVFLQNGTNTTLRPRSKSLYNGCMMRWTESGKKGGFLLWGRFGKSLRVLVVMVPDSSLSEMMQTVTIGRGVALGAILTPRRGKRKMRLDTYIDTIMVIPSRLLVTPPR